jgi:hypothetical protein
MYYKMIIIHYDITSALDLKNVPSDGVLTSIMHNYAILFHNFYEFTIALL